MLLGPLLGNLLTWRGLYRTGQGMYRTGQGLKKNNFISSSEKYFKNVKGFNEVFSRNILPKLKKAACVIIYLDHLENAGTHWVVIFVNKNEVIYFDSFWCWIYS